MARRFFLHIVRFLPFTLLRKLANRSLIGINYHSIAGEDADPVINKNIYRSKNEFEADIQFLMKHFDVISPDELLQATGSVQKGNKPKVFLTFDDGLAIQYHSMVPILKKYNLKAIFFINPSFIDNKELHYKRKINHLYQLLENKQVNEVRDKWESLFASIGIEPSFTVSDLYRVSYKDASIIDRLAKLFDISFADVLEQQAVYITSEQIREMISDGFYFGGHSMDHPNYSELNVDKQIAQSIESTRWVLDTFGLKYALFAFPMNDQKISRHVIEQIHKEVDLSFGINGMMDDFTHRHIPRITVEQTGKSIRQCLKYEYLKYIFLRLKNGKIYRRP